VAGKARRILIGCGIGCGSLILITMIAVISFIVWINRPGTIPDHDERFGPQSTAFVEWTLDLDDPGTARVIDEFMTGAEQLNQNVGGDSSIAQMFIAMQNRGNRKQIDKLFPALFTWVHDSGTDGEDLITISARGFGNQLRFMDWLAGLFVANDSDDVNRYRQETIYLLPQAGLRYSAGFLRRATLFISRDLEAAKRTIDRLDSLEVHEGPVQLDEWLDRISGDARIRGAILNVDGDLQAVWESILGPDESIDWDRIRAVVVHGGFDEQTNLRLQLDFVCSTTGCDGVDLSSLSDSMKLSIGNAKIEVDTEEAGPADARRVTVQIADASGWVRGIFEREGSD